MLILRILGGIDLIAALTFLMLSFGINVYPQILVFSAGLLIVKGMFIFTGDILSFIDLFSALALLISVFFSLPAIILWMPTFLLLAKGFVSFF